MFFVESVDMAIPPDNPGVSIFPRLVDSTATPAPSELEREIMTLFDEMRDRLLRYSLGFGLSISDAEEVVQDVFLALYRHLARGKSRTALRAWLFQVTHNLSLKRRIALTRQPADSAPEHGEPIQVADPYPNPEDLLAFRQRRDRLRSVVDALPELDRQCLRLRAEGLRYREIAEVLGVSLGGVANSLARSLARLSAVAER